MTAIIGNDGSISTWPSTHGGNTVAVLLDIWRARFDRTIVEITGFGDLTLRRNRGGNIAISGAASGKPDTGAGPGVKAGVSGGAPIVLVASVGKTFSFTGLTSSVQLEANKNAGHPLVYEFVNGDSDTLTETW